MFVKVFKLGEDDPVNVFHQGTHVFGRGPSLQCNDKRVSRNHASIEVTQHDVKITANHINPCFLKVANSKTITILQKDETSVLGDGDTFAFLPDAFWFKIKIEEEDETKDINEQALKRQLNDAEDEAPEKRQKIDEVIIENEAKPSNDTVQIKEETVDAINEDPTLPNNEIQVEVDASNQHIKIEEVDASNQNIKTEEVATSSKDNKVGEVTDSNEDTKVETETPANEDTKVGEGAASNDDIKTEEPEPKEDNGTGPSTSDKKPKPRRERCWYGAQCYRKNPVHRQDLTHPGDSDYGSDPEDDRPSCSFGAACYRKNKDHRREYKHPPRQPPSKKKRTRKKVDRLNVGDYDEDDLSDISEDPFSGDDSDDYVQDSDGEDTDWEDSQKVDEDSENMKRLVKEANRFTKK